MKFLSFLLFSWAIKGTLINTAYSMEFSLEPAERISSQHFSHIIKTMEMVHDDNLSEPSRQNALEQTKTLFSQLNESSKQDFFYYLIGNRLLTDNIPEDYLPYLTLFYDHGWGSEVSSFKEGVGLYKQAYEQPPYSAPQLALVEQAHKKLSSLSFTLLNDILSLHCLKVFYDNQEGKKLLLSDFQHIIRIINTLESTYKDQVSSPILKIQATAYFALNQNEALEEVKQKILHLFPKEIRSEEKDLWITEKNMSKWIAKFFIPS